MIYRRSEWTVAGHAAHESIIFEGRHKVAYGLQASSAIPACISGAAQYCWKRIQASLRWHLQECRQKTLRIHDGSLVDTRLSIEMDAARTNIADLCRVCRTKRMLDPEVPVDRVRVLELVGNPVRG